MAKLPCPQPIAGCLLNMACPIAAPHPDPSPTKLERGEEPTHGGKGLGYPLLLRHKAGAQNLQRGIRFYPSRGPYPDLSPPGKSHQPHKASPVNDSTLIEEPLRNKGL